MSTLAGDLLWENLMSIPVTTEAANEGIIITVLLIAAMIITFKPDFSRL